MNGILGDFADIESAFERPTLTLLNRPDRQVMFAVLRLAFSRETQGVQAPILHRRVEQHLIDLANVGIEVPLFDGQIDGKQTCRRWLGHALDKDRNAEGQEFYTLSAAATEGLAMIGTMTRDRSGLSEHRVATIMSAVSDLNLRINPDVTERIRILDVEIADRQMEREQLLGGGELEPVDDDYVIDGFDNLLRLFGALPGDFRRVVDRMTDQRRAVIAKFQGEPGRIGDHLKEYLDMAEALMSDTVEGRAFLGAVNLFRDSASMTEFSRNIDSLLANPQAQMLLRDTERRDLRNLLVLMRQGFSTVLDARTRMSGLLRDQILTHNVTRDVALEQALRSLEAAVQFSLEVGKARDQIECDVLPHRSEIEDMPASFHDPADDLPPEALPVQVARKASPSAFADLLGKGGPSLVDLRRALIRASDAAPNQTLGEIFRSLPASLRRPVEVMGMLHLAGAISSHHRRQETSELQPDDELSQQLDDGLSGDLRVPDDAAELGVDGAGLFEHFHCVRPDGTEVAFNAPRVHLDPAVVDRLRAADQKTGAAR
jgi:hypothetical protein